MTDVKHLTLQEMEAGLDEIRQAPIDDGLLRLIVRRPGVGVREVLQEGRLDLAEGLVGDTWLPRATSSRPDRSPHPNTQVTVVNARAIALIAQTEDRWALAGDQLYVDLNTGLENLPAGTQLSIGSAVIEVTAEPHTGCVKFVSRYGSDARTFVNSSVGRQLNLSGHQHQSRAARGGPGRRLGEENGGFLKADRCAPFVRRQ